MTARGWLAGLGAALMVGWALPACAAVQPLTEQQMSTVVAGCPDDCNSEISQGCTSACMPEGGPNWWSKKWVGDKYKICGYTVWWWLTCDENLLVRCGTLFYYPNENCQGTPEYGTCIKTQACEGTISQCQ